MATTTSRAAIVAAARTPIGTARKGTLANMPAIELAKPVVQAVVERSGLDAADFDDLVLAESMQGGGDSARYIAVALGMLDIPGLAVNRQCASSLSAIAVGAGQIASGMSRAILAGGMESLSTGPIMQKRKLFTAGKSPEDYAQWFPESHPPTAEAPAMDMSITVAHNCNLQYGITREDQDKWALRSHQRAIRAIDTGAFTDEIIPLQVPQADGSVITFAEDEHPRRGSSMESLAGLKVLHPEIEGFTVTAGNSSGINDAAAVVALASPDTQQEVLASVLSWTQVGLDPTRTGSGRSKLSRRRSSWRAASSRMLHYSKSTRRSPLRRWRVRANSVSTRRSSTSTARASAWATRSPQPAPAWSPRRSTNCAGAVGVSACCQCAPAVVWVPRWSLRWPEMTALITEDCSGSTAAVRCCSRRAGVRRVR